ncbi:MAG: ATP-grasp domain-containing protein [archaeon]
MRIALVYNGRPGGESWTDLKTDDYLEFDSDETITAMQQAISSAGHEVDKINADHDAYEKLRGGNFDFVFNYAEGLHGESRESHIPAILEMLKIPYSGSGVLSFALALDKFHTKRLLKEKGIPTPDFQLFRGADEQLKESFSFPLIVKPNSEGSSKGIMNNCLVQNENELRERVAELLDKYKQSVIVEKFLPGREFTASILGNGGEAVVLPLAEITYSDIPEDLHPIDSYEMKWKHDNPREGRDPVVCPPELDAELESQIKKAALDTFNALECRDWARVDIRLDENNVPNVLEINPFPGLMPDPLDNSRFTRSAYAAGMKYDAILLTVLNSALKRYGMHK